MFGLLTRTRRKKKRAPTPRPVRLGLERLETRDTPSTITLSVAYSAGRGVTLSGDLTDTPNRAGQSVMIYGQASGTAVTDMKGHYTITLRATALGEVYSKTADGQSNIAQVTLTDTAPVISNFKAAPNGGYWTFSGDVAYRCPGGLTVTFGGQPVDVAGKTTTVNSAGTFSLTVRLNGTGNDNGTVTACIVDPWGLTSNTVSTYVLQMGT